MCRCYSLYGYEVDDRKEKNGGCHVWRVVNGETRKCLEPNDIRMARDPDLSLAVVPGRLGLFDPGLVGLGHSVHDTGDTTDSDGGDVAKVGWVAEEQDARGSDGEPAVHQ